jgi:hypothetical protein
VQTALACPPVSEPKHTNWPRIRDELFATDWDLLLCSAGSLSAILCEHARKAGRKALDLGALDSDIVTHPTRTASSTALSGSRPTA